MATKGSVVAEANSHPIVLFVSSSCPYCQRAVKELSANGFDAKVIQASPSQRDILKAITGSSSVPNCWVKGQFVGGCNDGPESWMGITTMIKSGKLTELLR